MPGYRGSVNIDPSYVERPAQGVYAYGPQTLVIRPKTESEILAPAMGWIQQMLPYWQEEWRAMRGQGLGRVGGAGRGSRAGGGNVGGGQVQTQTKPRTGVDIITSTITPGQMQMIGKRAAQLAVPNKPAAIQQPSSYSVGANATNGTSPAELGLPLEPLGIPFEVPEDPELDPSAALIGTGALLGGAGLSFGNWLRNVFNSPMSGVDVSVARGMGNPLTPPTINDIANRAIPTSDIIPRGNQGVRVLGGAIVPSPINDAAMQARVVSAPLEGFSPVDTYGTTASDATAKMPRQVNFLPQRVHTPEGINMPFAQIVDAATRAGVVGDPAASHLEVRVPTNPFNYPFNSMDVFGDVQDRAGATPDPLQYALDRQPGVRSPNRNVAIPRTGKAPVNPVANLVSSVNQSFSNLVRSLSSKALSNPAAIASIGLSILADQAERERNAQQYIDLVAGGAPIDTTNGNGVWLDFTTLLLPDGTISSFEAM